MIAQIKPPSLILHVRCASYASDDCLLACAHTCPFNRAFAFTMQVLQCGAQRAVHVHHLDAISDEILPGRAQGVQQRDVPCSRLSGTRIWPPPTRLSLPLPSTVPIQFLSYLKACYMRPYRSLCIHLAIGVGRHQVPAASFRPFLASHCSERAASWPYQ